MNRLLSFLVTTALIFTELVAQTTPASKQSSIDKFFKKLISDTTDLSKYCDNSEFVNSMRLGIKYEGVKNKFLISYDIDKNVKDKISNGSYNYELKKVNADNKGYEQVTFTVPGLNYRKEFYFHDGKYISPVTFFTKSWKRLTTRYFSFIISDTTHFNNYSSDQLEQYCEGMLSLLKIPESEKDLLKSQKIKYIVCQDSAEIKKITGFNTRGIYLLAGDEIISTFNCHFHELAHLLMNFKIKNNSLFCLPFLQEGFASATGGRGGIARTIITDVGYFLEKSGYIPYNSIITYRDFSSEDASVTYPVAALYSLFLMNELGIESYIGLYRSYSGNFDFVSNITTEEVKLPSVEKYKKFLNKFKRNEDVKPESSPNKTKKVYSGSEGEIFDENDYYLFKIKGDISLKSNEYFQGYKSARFEELFPTALYSGEKYLISVQLREVKIYNLFTNNLIATYSTGLSFDQKTIPNEGGYFEFLVKKDIFNEGLENLQISEIKQ
jgi:hypothetical protein